MPVIRANRDSVDDRFSVLGFSIRTEAPLYEVAIASDPELFKAENRGRRNRHNFYSSRAVGGALRARRGEAVYLVPADVMLSFVGQQRIYYGLATYPEDSGGVPNFVQAPTEGNMFVNVATLTERGLRRLAGRPSGGSSYGTNGASMTWGGDIMSPASASASAPGTNVAQSGSPAASDGRAASATNGARATNVRGASGVSGANGITANGVRATNGMKAASGAGSSDARMATNGGGAGSSDALKRADGNGTARGAGAAGAGTNLQAGASSPQSPAVASSLHYDDGFGAFPEPPPPPKHQRPRPPAGVATARVTRAMSDTDDYESGGGIDGPIPDDDAATSMSQAVRALDATQPEYPGASRFAPAHSSNYQASRGTRTVDHVVIHITDGGSKITGTIGWFQNPDQRNAKGDPIHVSAHYVVGQDGEVVQMVRNNDVAWHASRANGHSIGIEHVANKRGLKPTEAQYQASAQLVAWLCGQLGVAVDRDHIVGHQQISPWDNHDCPSKMWDWDHYMDLVTAAAAPAQDVQSQGLSVVRSRAVALDQGSPLDQFDWPAGMAEPNYLVKQFIEAYGARVADGFTGAPAPDPTQYKGYQDADDRARDAALKHYIPRITDALLSDSERSTVSEAVLMITTAASLQVLDVIKDRLPQTFYAPIGIGAPPPAPSTDLTMPRMLQFLSRRIGTFMAWVDVAIQNATSETAERIRLQKEQWGGLLSLLDASFSAVGLMPGLGLPAFFVGNAVHLIVTELAPNFDRQYASFTAAMQGVRASYRALAAAVLKGLIQQRLSNQQQLNDTQIDLMQAVPPHPDIQAYLDEHAGQALLGWQNELAFLGVGAGATAQSLGTNRATRARVRRTVVPVRAQEIITPFYDPKDPSTALTCQNDAFSQAREEWFVGVDNTKSFPHSAICQINTVDSAGNGWGGTGFYIGHNRILTAAHVLSGMVTATIIPGKNGTEEPFGNCTVNSSSWRVAPSYTGNGNYENDLAVIDNVPIAAPNGQWFSFLNATPSDHLSLVVCGYSAASDAVPELTQAIDGDKQHLHGGYARAMSNPEVIEYPILTLHGASGAPVYHIDNSTDQLQALVCAVHVTGAPAAQGLNRGCFITPTKIDWIEGRAKAFALGVPPTTQRAAPRTVMPARSTAARTGSGRAGGGARTAVATKALEATAIDNNMALIPQPDKLSCWAASMAMLLSFRRQASYKPETLANEVGQSLMQSYGWDLLSAVRTRYGFTAIDVPSNTSLYVDPTQWARWLQQYGPLWVVIVGMPHAVVIAGLRGDTADPSSVEVRILNPWDTRVEFDDDPVAFHPANQGYDSWQPFSQFAADFGNMAEPNYGNWRILHLPATTPAAQSLSASARARSRWAVPPPHARSQAADVADGDSPIEPSRVAGTTMKSCRGQSGRVRWRLDQLSGMKQPSTGSLAGMELDNVLTLDDWPKYSSDAVPLPVTVHWTGNGVAVGNVHIEPGEAAPVNYDVEVAATIDDDPQSGAAVATLKVILEYRFRGTPEGDRTARVDLRLYGNGSHDRDSRWI